jgi:hypothetical protein
MRTMMAKVKKGVMRMMRTEMMIETLHPAMKKMKKGLQKNQKRTIRKIALWPKERKLQLINKERSQK